MNEAALAAAVEESLGSRWRLHPVQIHGGGGGGEFGPSTRPGCIDEVGLKQIHGGRGVEFVLGAVLVASVASALAKFSKGTQRRGHRWRCEAPKSGQLLFQQWGHSEGDSCLATGTVAHDGALNKKDYKVVKLDEHSGPCSIRGAGKLTFRVWTLLQKRRVQKGPDSKHQLSCSSDAAWLAEFIQLYILTLYRRAKGPGDILDKTGTKEIELRTKFLTTDAWSYKFLWKGSLEFMSFLFYFKTYKHSKHLYVDAAPERSISLTGESPNKYHLITAGKSNKPS
eukprot:g46569.t1